MELLDEAMQEFVQLLNAAKASVDPEPTAMTLATLGADGQVSARTVLLKHHDRAGFVFYTNTTSTKGRQLAAHAQCALLFHWRHVQDGIQVRIEGRAQPVSEPEADAYFASRPRISQLGAWASLQSQALDARATLEARLAAYETEYAGRVVPRPPHWSGYRVVPHSIEFWYGQTFRLHDRQVYRQDATGQWSKSLLYP